MNDRPPPLDPELVQEFVATAHGDPDAVRNALAKEPALVNAAWDWGGGDWETGLGAAAHMGRRDIALFLLEHGARLDVFAAAMLGELEIVRALLAVFPELREARGPHGIPLLEHAKAGGDEARAVVGLLKGADSAAPTIRRAGSARTPSAMTGRGGVDHSETTSTWS